MPGIDDAHDLIPAALELPPLGATEGELDPIVQVRIFSPDSQWVWLLTEFGPMTRMAYGLVIGWETEFGYVSLTELEPCRGPLGLRPE